MLKSCLYAAIVSLPLISAVSTTASADDKLTVNYESIQSSQMIVLDTERRKEIQALETSFKKANEKDYESLKQAKESMDQALKDKNTDGYLTARATAQSLITKLNNIWLPKYVAIAEEYQKKKDEAEKNIENAIDKVSDNQPVYKDGELANGTDITQKVLDILNKT